MRNSLRTRVTIFFVSLAIVPLVFVGFILTYRSFTTQVPYVLDAQSQVVQRVGVEVENFIRARENELRSLADSRNFAALPPEEQATLLTNLLALQHDYDQLILINAAGQEEIHLSRLSVVAPDDLINWVGQDEFETPRTTGDTFFSSISINQNTGEPFMTISIPLSNLRTGQFSGVLVSNFRFKPVWDIMAQANVIGTGIVYMLDADNRVVAHPNPSVVLQGTELTPPEEDSFTIGLGGEDVALARQTLAFNEQSFVIIAEQPRSEALALALSNVYIASGATIVVIIIAAALGSIVAQQITQPIGELAHIARAVSQGDLSQQATVTSQDEIGTLGLAFNTMTSQLRGFIGTLEQRVVERTQELQQEQARAQSILIELDEASRLAQLASYEFKLQSQTIHFNNLFFTLLGTTPEAVGGNEIPLLTAVERFVHPDDRQRLLQDIATIGQDSLRGDLEYRLLGSDGDSRYFLFRYVVTTDQTGQPTGVKGALQDITDRKKAETNLRKFQLALERSTDAVFMTNLDGLIEYVNPAFEKTYGYSAAEAIGQTPRIIKSGLIKQEQYVQFWDALLHDQVVAGELTNKHKNGRLIPIEAMNTSILDASGNRLGFMATHRDITARRHAEDALTKRAAELETITQVATTIAAIHRPQEMLQTVVDQAKVNFGLYHAHIYLLDKTGEQLVLAAGADEAGRRMVVQGHTLLAHSEQSLVARAARTRQAVNIHDVTQAPDFLPNPLLPDTRSELAVPLIATGKVVGVLDVQSDQAGYFSDEDVRIQTILASQVAIVLENARANEQSTKTLQELDSLTRRLTREGWQTYVAETERGRIGFMFADDKLAVLPENGHLIAESGRTFTQPIVLRGEKVGQLTAADVQMPEEEFSTILQAVSQGLGAHLENLRLTEEAERRVSELGVVNEIGQALATEVDLPKILAAVVHNLSRAFNANGAYVALYDQEHQIISIPYLLDNDQIFIDEPSFPFGEGISTYIIKNRQALLVNQDTEHRLMTMGAIPTNTQKLSKSFLGVPMVVGDQVIGVLTVQDAEREGRFTEGDMNLLRTIASNVAVAIQNARLFAQTQKRAEREAKVNLISQKIQNATTVEGALQTAIQELGVALKARRTFVELTQKQ